MWIVALLWRQQCCSIRQRYGGVLDVLLDEISNLSAYFFPNLPYCTILLLAVLMFVRDDSLVSSSAAIKMLWWYMNLMVVAVDPKWAEVVVHTKKGFLQIKKPTQRRLNHKLKNPYKTFKVIKNLLTETWNPSIRQWQKPKQLNNKKQQQKTSSSALILHEL